jgi:hypothetical protein
MPEAKEPGSTPQGVLELRATPDLEWRRPPQQWGSEPRCSCRAPHASQREQRASSYDAQVAHPTNPSRYQRPEEADSPSGQSLHRAAQSPAESTIRRPARRPRSHSRHEDLQWALVSRWPGLYQFSPDPAQSFEWPESLARHLSWSFRLVTNRRGMNLDHGLRDSRISQPGTHEPTPASCRARHLPHHLGAVANSIVDTARSWVDRARLAMPGYRNRTVTVYHDHCEGGMTLAANWQTRPSGAFTSGSSTPDPVLRLVPGQFLAAALDPTTASPKAPGPAPGRCRHIHAGRTRPPEIRVHQAGPVAAAHRGAAAATSRLGAAPQLLSDDLRAAFRSGW